MDVEINFYMGINDEKEKSREDYVELRILYFIWVLGVSYYQGVYIGWVGEVQNIKIYPTTKNSYQARHIYPPSRIPKTGRSCPPPGQTCPASQPFPELTRHIRLLGQIPEVFSEHVWPQPGHVRPNPIPQQRSPGLGISGPQAGFQRGWSDMSDPRSGHVRFSNTPTTRFSWGL
jgi:hypothetical protein